MFCYRNPTPFSILTTGLFVLVAVLAGCSKQNHQTEDALQSDSVADTTTPPVDTTVGFQAVIDLPEDTQESFQEKAREIMEWTPDQVSVIAYALRGVTRIVRFSDLGLGNELAQTMPRSFTTGWPVVQSVRLHLGGIKTAVVTRVSIDTLPGPRARGEGVTSLMGIHGDTLFGRDVVLPLTQAGTGRFELLFLKDNLFAQTSCCDIPPTFLLDRYGKIGDTLTLIFTFDPALKGYEISVIGQSAGRTYPGFVYDRFRTERGEYHRDMNEYPFKFQSQDPAYVNLFVGSCSRGRKSVLEPVLKVTLF